MDKVILEKTTQYLEGSISFADLLQILVAVEAGKAKASISEKCRIHSVCQSSERCLYQSGGARIGPNHIS